MPIDADGPTATVGGDDSSVEREELLRAEFYAFLASLLSRPPTAEAIASARSLTGDDTELGRAIDTLARIAKSTSLEAAEREFNALFIGLGRGELMPFASFYMTGFLNEKPLAKLRDDMARLRIKRADNVYEPEDNIASLCDMMAGLIRGDFGVKADLDAQHRFFSTHIGPWAAHFFSDLESATQSVFYAPVGTIGRAFMEIEREAFRMEGQAA